VRWYKPVVPALGKQRQENYKFQAILCYTAKPYLKKTKPNRPYVGVHTCNSSFFGGGDRRVVTEGHLRKDYTKKKKERQK
jgi:hypothetical protein